MEFPKKVLFSKQGRLTTHLFPNLYSGCTRPRVPSSPLVSALELIKLRDSEENQGGVLVKCPAPSSSFKTFSREQYSFTQRNRSNSPAATRYSPKTEILFSRSDRAPQYRRPHRSPRKKPVIFLPPCVDSSLNCEFSSRKEASSHFGVLSKSLKRTVSSVVDYEEQRQLKELQLASVPERSLRRALAPDFSLMTERRPLVEPPTHSCSPFSYPTSYTISSNKRPSAVDFRKMSERKPARPALAVPYYDANREMTLPRLNRAILSFAKTMGRTPTT